MIEVFAGAQAEGLRVVGCRHEENAGFMAAAWGWQRRKPGVLLVGSGPGMTNAVTPLYVASASGMPLVVLGGSTHANTRGVGGFQEADQVAFAAPACKWTGQVDRTERIAEWVHLALGKALLGRPGGVYLDFPGHFVGKRVAEEAAPLRAAAPEVTRPHPDPAALERVADLLARAERPLVLIGKGAAWADAGAPLRRLVELGIPWVTSPMARGVVPDDAPHFANGARSAALRGADAILAVGARFNWIFGFGRAPRFREGVRIAQIDVEPEEMVGAAQVEIGLVADAAVAAQALCEALAGRTLRAAPAWREELAAASERNRAALAKVAALDAVPINPYRLVAEIRDVLPRDAIVSADGETIMGVCRTMLPGFRPRAHLNAGTTGCMGTGVPYALGSALACPERASVAVLGDYAFGAAAMEVETAARVGAKVVFVVANNEGIAGHLIQDHFLPPGSPRIASLLPAHYEKLAEMVDGLALRVERPDEIRPALERALAAERVAVVHVRVDPKATRIGGANYLE
jgi:thiamine pyrophosphate-dependent acetolactate synthase large subunit-like protein